MKFNFRKIATALASTAMVGSTVALAAAGTFPAPFAEDNVADVVYVYGSDLDLPALVDITTALSDAVQTGDGDINVPTEGDFVELNKGSNKFNLANNLATVYSKLDNDELSTVLADGTYTNDPSEDFDYSQDIVLSGEVLAHFQDDDYSDMPAIGLAFAKNDHIFNYTLDFDDPAEGGTNYIDLEDSDFPLLGREYYVLDASNSSSGGIGAPKMVLLDSANSATLRQGETSTVAGFSVNVDFISENNVILIVDGVMIDDMEEGDTKKIPGTETYLAVKSILYTGRESDQPRVDLAIGTGKITLEHNREVKVNEDDVDNLKAYFTISGTTDINEIVLEWNAEDDMWLAPGESILLPGFESIKIFMTEFFTDEDTTETFDLKPSGSDDIELNGLMVEDGEVTLTLLHSNGTAYTLIGESTTKRLATSTTTTIFLDSDDDEWFVATWISGEEHESFVLQLDSVDDDNSADNKTTIRSHGSGAEKTADILDTLTFGSIDLTIDEAYSLNETAVITITVPSGTGHFDRLITKEGLQILLPYDDIDAVAGSGAINFTGSANTYLVNFTEEDRDDNIASGDTFTITLGHESDGDVEVSSVVVAPFSGAELFETDDNSDKFVGYINSDLATKVMHDTGGSQNDAEITYFGSEAYARIFVAETEVVTRSGGGSEIDIIRILDSEFAAHDMNTKNAIVVGGTCVNSVAAMLLNVDANTCGTDWTAATGAGVGQSIIETFEHPYAADKVATLVAGWGQGDTVNAATALATQNIITDAGKKYTVGSDLVAVPVVI